MMPITNYIDRTADLLAFHVASASLPALTALVPPTGALLCVGVQKLAQRWLLELLTERGTIPSLPNRGTTFMTEARQGLFRTTLDAEQAYALADDQAATNLVAEETDDMPDDERLDRTELLSLSLSGDRLTLRVQLYSKAGETVEVIAPIAVRIG
jgi:hypothetical protein